MQPWRDKAKRSFRKGGPLTYAEAAMMELVCDGLTNAQIGALRNSSRSTVKTQIEAILTKLGAKNRTEAAAIFARHYEGGRI